MVVIINARIIYDNVTPVMLSSQQKFERQRDADGAINRVIYFERVDNDLHWPDIETFM